MSTRRKAAASDEGEGGKKPRNDAGVAITSTTNADMEVTTPNRSFFDTQVAIL